MSYTLGDFITKNSSFFKTIILTIIIVVKAKSVKAIKVIRTKTTTKDNTNFRLLSQKLKADAK